MAYINGNEILFSSRVNMNTPSSVSWNDLTDKPFYKIEAKTIVDEENIVMEETETSGVFEAAIPAEVITNIDAIETLHTYDITVNGETCESICAGDNMLWELDGASYAFYWSDEGTGNGKLVVTSETMMPYDAVSLKIASKEFIKKIDPEYLPSDARLDALEKQMADLSYVKIAVSSFKVNGSSALVVELGSTVTNPTLSWTLNKMPTTVSVNGEAVEAAISGSKPITDTVTSSKVYTMSATDEKAAMATGSATITFLNGVYYGVATEPSIYDSTFIRSLANKKLSGTVVSSISVTAGAGQYIYYCVPARFGACEFTVGGFTGGFSRIATIAFTNASGYTENYYIYRSDNANLGSTVVTVK